MTGVKAAASTTQSATIMILSDHMTKRCVAKKTGMLLQLTHGVYISDGVD